MSCVKVQRRDTGSGSVQARTVTTKSGKMENVFVSRLLLLGGQPLMASTQLFLRMANVVR